MSFKNGLSLWEIMPLLIVFYAAYLCHQNTVREIKRLDSITRSSVYAQFGKALNDLDATFVIRGGADQFIDEAERSLHDAIMIVQRAMKNSTIVSGGGAIDMEIVSGA